MDTIYNKKENLVTKLIGNETVIVPINNNVADMDKVFTLNPVASFIWEQLDGRKNTTEILGLILKNFNINKEQAEKDLKQFFVNAKGKLVY